VRPLFAAFLLMGVACSGFSPPTPEIFGQLRLSPPKHPGTTRYRIHMSVDSPWLAGEFDGVVLAHEGSSPMARAQLFGDLGPKMFDLVARPDRIAGYFPSTREGVDCALPGEAAPHPLLFFGVSLLEDFADISEDRVIGVREDGEGWWLNLKPVVPGLHSEARQAKDGRTIERRFHWMYGLSWGERREGRDACTITASGLVIKVHVLGVEHLKTPPDHAYDLSLPQDIRIVQGSRK
jgi:hypothetical protein